MRVGTSGSGQPVTCPVHDDTDTVHVIIVTVTLRVSILVTSLLAFSILTIFNFFVLLAGVISSVRLVIEIQVGFLNAEVIPELSRYETESWVK